MTVAYQTVLHVGPCEMCGEPFSVDREWWFERLLSGAPALKQCKGCHAGAHWGAPVVPQRGEE